MQLLDMMEMFVLSDDKMTPNKVAPSGSPLYNKVSVNMHGIHNIVGLPEVPMHDP